jgi:hypothetical protein
MPALNTPHSSILATAYSTASTALPLFLLKMSKLPKTESLSEFEISSALLDDFFIVSVPAPPCTRMPKSETIESDLSSLLRTNLTKQYAFCYQTNKILGKATMKDIGRKGVHKDEGDVYLLLVTSTN